MQDYWSKQDVSKPLFPDILWSRPENKQTAGKLLIVGGNAHGFVSPAQAFSVAEKAGAGTVKMVLPDSLRPFVGKVFTGGELAPSTPSGSFASTALAVCLDSANWADCVLLAGDLGRNSETAIMLESFVQKYSGPLVITQDAIDYFFAHSALVLDRPQTCIVGALGQIQKLAANARFDQAITTGLDLIRLVEVLHEFNAGHSTHIITHQLGTTLVAAENKISTTKTGNGEDIWRVPTAAKAATYWMQNLSKPFESLTTSLL